MLLKLKGIVKDFYLGKKEVFTAIKGLDLEFSKGSLVSILGPSGCGKSTLLNIIAGLDKPTNGELIIEGVSSKKFKKKDWDLYRKNNIGFVFQQFNLIEHLTALENVEIAMGLIGLSKAKRVERAKELLDLVGLSKHIGHKPDELSGGQKQRVSIARALANDPDIILADEPTGALDSKTGLEVMELLKEISKEKLVIMVTHNEELANNYSSRIVKMLDGKIISDETIKEEKSVIKSDGLRKRDSSMSFVEAFKLSLRNLKNKLGRMLIVSLAGSIGIAGIALIMAAITGTNNYIDANIDRFVMSNVLTVTKANAYDEVLEEMIYEKDISALDYLYDANESISAIRKKISIDTKEFSYNGEIYNDIAVSALQDEEYLDHIVNELTGRIPKENSYEILISNITAKKIADKEKIDLLDNLLGKTIEISISDPSNPLNIATKEFKIVGIVEQVDMGLFTDTLFINYQTAESIYKDLGIYDEKITDNTEFEVILNDVSTNKTVQNWINDPVNGGGNRNQVGTRASNDSVLLKNSFARMLSLAEIVMLCFVAVALVVSSILIAIVLFSSILERRKEIGILRAVGARNKDIIRVFESEAMIIGFSAGVLGLILSVILKPVIIALIKEYMKMDLAEFVKIPINKVLFFNVEFPLGLIISLVLLSVGVSFIAGYLPSRKATKMEVIDALREE